MLPIVTYSGVQFERGDAIYRYGAFGFGHAGLYIDWDPDRYPEDRTSHTIIDAITEGRDSVVIRNFRDFCSGGRFWSVRKWRYSFSADLRRKITDKASQIALDGARYNFFFGYKQPLGKDPSFRCDGLVEYCYETALGDPWWPGFNGGIVINDTWLTMAPLTQMLLLRREKNPTLDTVRFVTPGDGDTVSGSVLVMAYMHDGIFGSGVSKGQFWVDSDTSNMVEEVSPGDTWSTARHIWNSTCVKNGHHVLNARGFDQAGNTSVTSVSVLVNNIFPRVTRTYPEAHQEDVPPDTTIWIEFNKRMDTTSVENAVLFHPHAVFQTGWEDSSRLLLLEPELDLDYCSQYTITISDSARDQQGRRLDGDGDGEPGGEFRLSFHTGPPRIRIWADPPVSHINQGESVCHRLFLRNLSSDSISGTLCARGSRFGWQIQPTSLRSPFNLEPDSVYSDSILITNVQAVGPIEIEFGAELAKCEKSAEIYSWVAADHIMDHPDETHDISDARYRYPWPIDTESPIGVLLSGWSDGLGHLLGEFSIPTAIVKPDLSLLNGGGRTLSSLPVLLIGSAGLAGLSNSRTFTDMLDEYVYGGGVLVVLSQQNGTDFDCLPGVDLKAKGWNQDQSCLWRAAYIEEWHPILAGQEKPLIDCSVDGYFPRWPDNSTLILRRTSSTMPCLLTYAHGDGRVLVTSMFSDWGLGHSQTTRAERRLIRDIVTWALSPNAEIPVFAPNEQVSLATSFTNRCDREAAHIELSILSPDRETLATRDADLSPPLEPGEQRTIPITLAGKSILGIYPIYAQVFDSRGFCVRDEVLFDRFLVRREMNYQQQGPGNPRIWATTESEFVTGGSEVVYDVHIENPSPDSVCGTLLVGVHRNRGAWWAITDSLIGIRVAPDSSMTIQFTDTLRLSTSAYFGLYEGEHPPPSEFFTNATCYCQKGIWVGPPKCELMVDACPDTVFANDTLTLTALVMNRLPMEYEATLTARVIDPTGYPIWGDTVHLDVDATYGAADSIPFTTPPRPIPGIYTIEATCLHDSSTLAKSRAYFRIPASNLTARVHIPDTLAQTVPIEVCLCNTGCTPDSGGVVIADIESPEGDTVWTERAHFGLIPPSESTSICLWPSVRRARFGTYKLLLAVTHQGTPLLSSFQFESCLDSRLSIDPVAPAAGRPVTFTLSIHNKGKLSIDASAQIRAGDWCHASEEIEIQPKSSKDIQVRALIPDTLHGGFHPVHLTIESIDTLRIQEHLFLGEPSLSFSHAFSDISPLDTLNLFVLNDGKTSCNPLIRATLWDQYNLEIATTRQEPFLSPEEECTLHVTVPLAACSGEYLLEVTALDTLKGVSDLWQAHFLLEGASCELTAFTGREIYSSDDSIDIHVCLDNDSTELEALMANVISEDYRQVGIVVQDVADSGNTLAGCRLGDGTLEISPHHAWLETAFTFADGPSMPSYIALGKNNLLYTTDFFHNRVYVTDQRGRCVREWGTPGNGNGEFRGIWGIALDDSGYVFVSDFYNCRIQKFNTRGHFLYSWTVPGAPWDLCVDDSGFVYVVDFSNCKIRKYTALGVEVAEWGSAGTGVGQFKNPWGIGTDGSSIFVADTYNHRVQVFTRSGAFMRAWGEYGHDEGDFLYPSDVAVDERGLVYVGELGPYISKFTAEGEFIFRFSPQGEYPPAWSVATGDDGLLLSCGYHYLLNKYSVGRKGSITTKAAPLGKATRALSFVPRQILNGGIISYQYNLGTGWFTTRMLPSENLFEQSISFRALLERHSPESSSPRIRSLGLIYETARTGCTLWDDSTHMTLPADTTLTVTKIAEIDQANGRLYLSSALTNTIHQRVSSSVHPFFFSDQDLLVTFATSKDAYLPDEDVPITVKVGNSSDRIMRDIVLEIGTCFEKTLVDTFNLEPTQWDTSVAVVSSESSFSVYAVATTPDGDSTFVSGEVVVQPLSIVTDIHAPQFVSHAPFETICRLTNTSPHPLTLDLFILVGDSVVDSVERSLTPYSFYHRNQSLQIAESETVSLVIQGDLDTCVSAYVELAERATATPSPAEWYAPNRQDVPFEILNTGMFNVEYILSAVARDSAGRSISSGKTGGFVPTLGCEETSLMLDLPPGAYVLHYALVCSHGDTLQKADASINVREPYGARIDSVTVSGGNPGRCGAVTIVPHIRNTGAFGFSGDLSVASLFHQSSTKVRLEPTEVKSCTFNIDSNVPRGGYVLTSSLSHLGQLYDSCSNHLELAPSYEVATAETIFCQVGEMAFCPVQLRNTGNAVGLASVKLLLPSILEDSHSVCLDPCSSLVDTFAFLVPRDFETGTYNAVLSIDSLGADVTVVVSGLKMRVRPELDKESYAVSDTASLTLHVENLVNIHLDLGVRVSSGNFQADDFLALPNLDTADTRFRIPVSMAGDRVFYGFYLEGGRALYLDAVYLRRKKDTIYVYTDKNLYQSGDTAAAIVENTIPGIIFSKIFGKRVPVDSLATSPPGTTFSFVVPDEVATGTYDIDYTFIGSEQQKVVISGRHPFDVLGYTLRVLRSLLDKSRYHIGDTLRATHFVKSNRNLTGLVQAWIRDPESEYRTCYKELVELKEGANRLNCRGPILAENHGPAALVYGFFKPKPGNDYSLLLAAGIAALDLESLDTIPPEFLWFSVHPDTFNPLRNETTTLRFALSESCGTCEITIRDGQRSIIKSWSLREVDRIEQRVRWDGAGASAGEYSISSWADDFSGNLSDTARAELYVAADTLPPTTRLEIGEPRLGRLPVYITCDTPLSLNAKDDITGVARTEYRALTAGSEATPSWSAYSESFTLEGADRLLHLFYRSLDRARNLEESRQCALSLDNTPPEISFQFSGPQFWNEHIYLSPTTRILILSEDKGCGCASAVYNLDSDPAEEFSDTVSITIEKEGRHRIGVTSTDNLHNLRESEMTLAVDGTPPECVLEIGQPNHALIDGFLVTSSTPIVISASDPLVSQVASGTASIEYTFGADDPICQSDSAVVLLLSGADGVYYLGYSAKDRVDNASRKKTVRFVLDNTSPVCEIELPYDSTLVSRSISLIGTVDDKYFQSYQVEYGSGLNPVKWTKDGPPLRRAVRGSLLKEFNTHLLIAQGPFLVRVIAKDLVDNTSVDSVLLHSGEVTVSDTLPIVGPLRVDPAADAVYITTRAGLYRTTPQLTNLQPVYHADDLVDAARVSRSELALLSRKCLARAEPPRHPEVLVDGLAMTSGLDVDDQPRFYVARNRQDIAGGEVLRFNAQGSMTLRIANLADPRDVAVDKEHAVYVVEGERHTVSKFDNHGRLRLRFGGFGSTPGRLNRPNGIVVDAKGYIWVCDTGNGRIQVFDPLGNRLYDFNLPSSNSRGETEPLDISLLSSHSIYVADGLNLWVLRMNRPSLQEPIILSNNLPAKQSVRLAVRNLLNSPNPFNPDMQATIFQFFLSRSCDVRMVIFDMVGKIVGAIHMHCTEGLNEAVWDGRKASGDGVTNGVYYLKLVAEADDESVVKYLKIAVLR